VVQLPLPGPARPRIWSDFAPLSAQQTIPGADHYHDDYEDALTTVVIDWLDTPAR